MRLLILTQTIDKNDPVLGFMHRWVSKLANNFEKITVIALQVGEHELPINVHVLELGRKQRLKALWRFYTYIWQYRRDYDAVFVHMNQEYVLLAGDIWRLLGKKVYLWRNHAAGNMLTDMAIWMSRKVFYTSSASYTARFPKSVKMPIGVDTDFFRPDPNVMRVPRSVLFLGRISPVKKVFEFLDWVMESPYIATVAGPLLERDREYGEVVLKRIEESNGKVRYVGPVTQEEALKLFQTHEIYVNKTPAGSFDKTIIEAAASGCKLMVDNPDARDIHVAAESLTRLCTRLAEEIS